MIDYVGVSFIQNLNLPYNLQLRTNDDLQAKDTNSISRCIDKMMYINC